MSQKERVCTSFAVSPANGVDLLNSPLNKHQLLVCFKHKDSWVVIFPLIFAEMKPTRCYSQLTQNLCCRLSSCSSDLLFKNMLPAALREGRGG